MMAVKTTQMTAWKPPTEFDGYRVSGCIGRGGMGEVYLGHDSVLDRPVALKFISTSADPGATHRFLVEARALARLQHPNVVAIFRVGEVEGRPYLASEFVAGTALDQLPLPQPIERALRIGLGLAAGLAAAHRRGVLHGDLKPSNVIVGEGGEVKLLDFGLAKLVDTATPDASAKLLGTPGYLAPEIWRGEPYTARADVYALGAVLYQLLAGSPPHQGDDVQALASRVITTDAKPIASRVKTLDSRLAEVVDRCLCREASSRFASGDEVLDALEQSTRKTSTAAIPEGNAFRGLRAFEAEHRALFFGREWDIRSVIERLRSEPFVLVSGASGVGKSSLCRAGVLPRVLEGALGPQRSWQVSSLFPGRTPLRALSGVLAEHWESDPTELAARLERDPNDCARDICQRQGSEKGLVLFIDQMEEVLTLSDAGQAARFGEALQAILLAAPGFRLLGTVRGDFFSHLAALSGLGEYASQAFYLLRRLSNKGIRECIVGPARAKGFSFESDGMVDDLVQSSSEADGGLPLLQFTLTELWNMRDESRRVIPSTTLTALGGVAGALARHADAVIEGLDTTLRNAARRLLCQLVTPEGTRARMTLAELHGDDPLARSALDALIRGRLVVARDAVAQDDESGSSFEVAHEVLIRGWPRLQRWLHEDQDTRAVRDRLSRAAAEWDRVGRSPSALWGAPQLSEIGKVDLESLSARDATFVHQSRRALRRKKWMTRGSMIVLPALVVLWYGTIQLKASRDLRAKVGVQLQEGRALLRSASTQTEDLEKYRRSAFEYFDADQPAQGEEFWSQALSAAKKVDALYLHASSSLESAIFLDPTRRDTRALLAEVLFRRALLAERNHTAPVEELRQRLRLYDDNGDRQRQLETPGTIFLATRPPGAQISLARYEDADGRRVLGSFDDLGPAPITRDLKPGSYLFLVRDQSGLEVRYPVLVDRAENRELSIDLPLQGDIPAGFIYVPAGNFLTGSPDDENTRKLFGAAPLHRIGSSAFLIQRTETTHAEWIEFLQALPPGERIRRLPRAGGDGTTGALALKPVGTQGWEFTFSPGTRSYRARLGETITYDGRSRRVKQDWMKFPVSGVTQDDALAYLSWLRSSGRVPGARLCSRNEWERAARGADDRRYPHGDLLLPDDANFDETYAHQPSAMGLDEVGSHPNSTSPFGVDDLTGNVWELVDGPVPSNCVIRGGSYFQDRLASSSVNRDSVVCTLRVTQVGVRVCASPKATRP